jgi:phosphohistidine phosphatase SixA
VNEALQLKDKVKGVRAPEDFEALSIRAYTSPALRAMQTVAILKTDKTDVKISNAISETYLGWKDFANELRIWGDYFALFIVVTHQPVVPLLACELVGGNFEDPLFNFKTIRNCCGYLIDGETIERFE